MGVAASRQEAFWEACGFGHVDRVKKFLQDGDIDVNWVSYTHDCCPIHVASQGKTEIVKMLLDAKCSVNVTDIRGNLPLHHAAMKGHDDIIKMLIDAGSEINTQDKNGWTPLHCAAYWNHPKAVKVLLKNNADATIQNKDERTALHETARSPERDDFKLGEIARCLIEAGSDVNAKSSDLGEADFTGLMFASYHNHPDVASAFIDACCEINAYGTNRWTALHWAADRGNDELVFLLLEAGADPTIKGWRHERAVDRAQSPEIKEILMNAINMFEELSLLEKVSPQTEQVNELPAVNRTRDVGPKKVEVNFDSSTKPLTTKQNDIPEKNSVEDNKTDESNFNPELENPKTDKLKYDIKEFIEKPPCTVDCNSIQKDSGSSEEVKSVKEADLDVEHSEAATECVTNCQGSQSYVSSSDKGNIEESGDSEKSESKNCKTEDS